MPMVGCGDDSGVCESFCAKDAECFSPEDQFPRCEQGCRYALDVSADISAKCGDAAADVFACVADLATCEEVNDYWFEIPPDSYPCKNADDAAESACLSVGPFEVQP
jgi:hypothetical protein